jgi:methyl-accepting chemotaxis protein
MLVGDVHIATDIGAFAACLTILAMFVSAVVVVNRKIIRPLGAVLKATKANGLDTDSTGDSSKRTEIAVGLLHEEFQRHATEFSSFRDEIVEKVGQIDSGMATTQNLLNDTVDKVDVAVERLDAIAPVKESA